MAAARKRARDGKLRVVQYGLGAIGRAVARLVLDKERVTLVGAVDCSPQVVGRDVGSVIECGKQLGVSVSPTLSHLLKITRADAVIHCTGSSFSGIHEQLIAIAEAGLHCVTSCEEALFPHVRHHILARRLHEICVRNGVGIVGTGVNPGFVMDTLPVMLTAVSQRVLAIRVLRVVDAGTRREALQRKVGAGMSPSAFRSLVRQGKLGHAGLMESLSFVANGLGWRLDRVTEEVKPVIAKKEIRTKYLRVPRGAVAGVQQVARGVRNKRDALTLELQMYVGAEKPRDEIVIEGQPSLRAVIEGGTPGDAATPAILVNMLPRLREAPPGLHTMQTLALPRITG